MVSASGNGTVHIDIYAGDEVVRSAQGTGEANLGFQWSAGFFTVVCYLMSGTSVLNYTVSYAPVEQSMVISGYIMDFMDDPVNARIELVTGKGVFTTESEGGHYTLDLKAPYEYEPGEKASLRVCAGSDCETRDVWLNGTELRHDFRISPSAGWPAYLGAIGVFLLGAVGYMVMFDPARKEERMKKFKRTRRLKRMKKVIWVKDITDRQEELAELKGALERAEAGKGSTIFLTGEEGVGKKTLIEKFRQDTGVKSVLYECKGSARGKPYEPIKKIISIMQSSGMNDMDVSSLFSKGSKEQIFDAVFQAVKKASEKEAVLVTIFNAQWLDEGSIDLIGYVARGMDETKILFVVSAPQEELEDVNGKPHPLNLMLMELIMEGKVRMIKLERFDMENTREMLQNILGTEIPDETLEKIYDMTRGLPLMTQEVAIAIKKAGMNINDPDSLEIEIPSTVKELVARRQSKMDDKEREVAEWAAILGGSFSYDDLKELSDAENLNNVLYSLIEDRIITEEGGMYSFDHPEIRNGILESLGERRKEMHLKAAKMLESRGASNYDLACQFCEAGEKEKCLKYSLLAAEDAERSYAYKSALKYYLNAVPLLEEAALPEIYLKMASDYYKLMDYDASIEYAEKVIYSESPDELKYRAYRRVASCHLENSRWDEAMEMYRKLMESPDVEMQVEAYRGMGKIYWRTGKHDLALENVEKAIELAQEINDMVLASSMKVDLANIQYDRGNYEEAERLYLEAADNMEKEGALFELARTYNNLGEVYRYGGRMDEAIDAYQKCIEFSEKSNSINTLGYGLENLGTVYASLGRLDEAREYLDGAHKIFSKNGNKYMISGIHMAYGIIYTKERKWDEADREFRISAEMLIDIDVKYDLGVTYLEHARMFKEKGDVERALEMYGKAREVFEEVGAKEHLKKIEEETEGL